MNKMWGLIIVLGVLWGSAGFLRELIIVSVHPFVSSFLRLSFASVLLLAIYGIKNQGMYHNNKLLGVTRNTFIPLIFVGIFSTFLPFVVVTYAQMDITGGLAIIIVSATVFNTMILSAIFIPSEKLKLHRLVGAMVGVSGVAIAVGVDTVGGTVWAGILAFCGAISYAVGAVITRLYLRDCPLLSCVTIAHLVGFVCISILLIITGYYTQFIHITPMVWVYGFLLALLPSVIGGLLYFYVLENYGASNSLLGTIISAPSAMILGGIFLGEDITPAQLWGVSTVILGLILLDGRILKKL